MGNRWAEAEDGHRLDPQVDGVGSGFVVVEGGRQFTVRVGLGEEVAGLLLDRGHRVGAGDPAQRGLVEGRRAAPGRG